MIGALVLSLCGSILFSWLQLPLGAMFGAIVFLMVAGKAGLRLSLPAPTLTFVQLVLGIGVGVMVPSDLSAVNFPPLMLLGLVACMIGQVTISYLWLHKREQWSKTDSLLGSVPGAMAAVLVLNEAQQKPSGKVVFTHTVRLITLVILSGVIAADNQPVAFSFFTGQESYWLLAVAAVAWGSGVLLEKIGTPAPYMVTGMLTAIAVGSMMPAASLAIPPGLVFIATSALGALIGIRLVDVSGGEFITHMRSGVIATALSLGVTLLFAFVFSQVLAQSFVVLLMSWVPGSIEAMTVAAIYLGLEPALIMLNHITRMVILHSLPLAVKPFLRPGREVRRSEG
ncbi:AbrB family transcriptional regulator [Photobacterium atrarenae]|uniref:AbrB family transcriptional regulator n=1 Tax=Photobacterium atrarenae TaxID=865757 RepID=A0ABY5GPP3_9GAMM|nr:AbrB family transcriptional regulator [Photobacterium atrarenae]UTV30790.1 AbrB family transcriptional regulator [Photobacterium atrarenae]